MTVIFTISSQISIFLSLVGLQDLEVCDFDEPGLCNFKTNYTAGSDYRWKVTKTSDVNHGPGFDADGNTHGKFNPLYTDGFSHTDV